MKSNKKINSAFTFFIVKLLLEGTAFAFNLLFIYNGKPINLKVITGILYCLSVLLTSSAIHTLYENYSVEALMGKEKAHLCVNNTRWGVIRAYIRFSFKEGRPSFIFNLLETHIAFVVSSIIILMLNDISSWKSTFAFYSYLPEIICPLGSFLSVLLVTILIKKSPVAIKQQQDTIG